MSEQATHVLHAQDVHHVHRPQAVTVPESPEDIPAATVWPPHPEAFPDLMNPVEAAQYLRLDQTGRHTPKSPLRTKGKSK